MSAVTARHGIKQRIVTGANGAVLVASLERMVYSNDVVDGSGVRLFGKTLSELASGTTDLDRWNSLKLTRTVTNLISSHVLVTHGRLIGNSIAPLSGEDYIEFIDLGTQQSALYMSATDPAAYDDATGTQIGTSGGIQFGSYLYSCIIFSTTTGYSKSERAFSPVICYDDFDVLDLFGYSNIIRYQYAYFDRTSGIFKYRDNSATVNSLMATGDWSTSADYEYKRGAGFALKPSVSNVRPNNYVSLRVTPGSTIKRTLIAISFDNYVTGANYVLAEILKAATGSTSTGLAGITQSADCGSNQLQFRYTPSDAVLFTFTGPTPSGKNINMTSPNGAVVILDFQESANNAPKTVKLYYCNAADFNPATDVLSTTISAATLQAFNAGTLANSEYIAGQLSVQIQPGKFQFHEMVILNVGSTFTVSESLIRQIGLAMLNKVK